MKKSLIRWLIGLVIILVCGTGPANASSGKPLIIGTTESLTSLDPADSNDFFTWEVLTHLYTGLTRQEPGSLSYELALAEAHTVSADGLTHTFSIRPGAAFDDGTPITAQTFADSISRVLELNGRGKAAVAPYVKTAAVSAAGELVLTLTAPIPFLEQLVALPPYFPVHPTTFPADKLVAAPAQPVTNGIYRVSAFASDSLTLAADPAWKGDPPATDSLIIKHFALPADLREALKAQQVDIAWRGLPLDDAAALAPLKTLYSVNTPGLQTFYLLFGGQAPYDDPVVRRGMAYLLDRERAIRGSLGDTTTPLYTLVPPELSRANTPRYPSYDADQAQRVLAEGDYSQFKRIESELQTSRLLYGDRYASAVDILNSALTRNEAFRITRLDTEPRTFLDQIERGMFRLIVVGWAPIVPHEAAYLRPLLAGQLAAGTAYDNSKITALLDQAALTSAGESLYDEVQTIALQAIVAVPLWQNRQIVWAGAQVDRASILIEPNFLLRYDKLRLESRP
jgi:peptide/nickel transport system substrate-binding protein